MSKVIFKNLGIVDYAKAWSMMKEYVSLANTKSNDEIWFCEHPKVFTLGIKADPSHILIPGSIPVVRTDRGGEVTYHGPGQIVCYPLINLRKRKIFPKSYLWKIEEAVIQTLNFFEVSASRVKTAPGVYVLENKQSNYLGPFNGLKKICSIGIKISNDTTYHGLAINYDADLRDFKRIEPCGYHGLQMINFVDLVDNVSKSELIRQLERKLLEQFCEN